VREILSGVKFRRTSAVVVAALAVSGLAGCKTNVGTAAVVDGHRITESDVNDFVLPTSQPVQQQASSGAASFTIAPRSFVLNELIYDQLGLKLLRLIPEYAHFTSAQLDARLAADLAGETPKKAAEGLGLKGYPSRFYRIVLRVQELQKLIQSAVQAGADLTTAIRGLRFPVSVNPRYGSWDKKHLVFKTAPPVPSYLDVRPAQQQPFTGTQ
jgi:hypothetical protein